jgi:hypothetical protein
VNWSDPFLLSVDIQVFEYILVTGRMDTGRAVRNREYQLDEQDLIKNK